MAKQGEDSPTHEKMRKATVSETNEGQHHADALEVQYRDIDTLIPYVSNARTHTDEQIAQIAASIKEFGWTNPVLVDGENGIIAGHGRVQAARKLQETHIPIIELHGLSDVQKRAYILADNQIAINAGWDGELLLNELERLRLDDFDISITGLGFMGGDIDDLLNTPLTDPNEEWQDMPEFNQEDDGSVQKIVVHFKTENDVQDFAKLINQAVTSSTKFVWFPPVEIGVTADKRYLGDES